MDNNNYDLDEDYDDFQDSSVTTENDDIEQDEQITKNIGESIFDTFSDSDLRHETNEFLVNYVKQKANRKTAEQEIYNLAYNKNTKILDKDLYIRLLTSFVTEISQYGLKSAYDSLVNNTLIWDHAIFKNIKEYEDKEVAKRLKPVEIKEGIYECPKCKGKKTQSYEVQLRRADEPATVFIECVNPKCRYKWKIN